ncbi:hypothetical protein T484DRAFT_1919808, partial [Baffinella frigidus]
MEEVERAFFKNVAQGQALSGAGAEGEAGGGVIDALRGVDVDGLLAQAVHVLHGTARGGEAMDEVERAFFQQVAAAREQESSGAGGGGREEGGAGGGEGGAGGGVTLDTSALKGIDVDGLLKTLSLEGDKSAGEECYVVKVPTSNAKAVKEELSRLGILDRARKVVSARGADISFPLLPDADLEALRAMTLAPGPLHTAQVLSALIPPP